ncbi:biotin--[acetyl-CoA-carboxylase] ligase [Qipengyuania oceanensis]|uniref:biotin--[biotin carboxyl-carrier protein] ligase n=1 Tax=Qipengyuania oceanensis TaxID=1463597 RepID=A0A844YDS6_9SPHN|nr:biotin--[acetyl-CoA-carboxylase] ligase [Qipengyuania oceanensis]MXO61773.1 biotin--[acetyl-CoA-carboxylase] ligase [Qipengyuania oceanensis]
MIEFIAETGSTNADLATRLSARERVGEGDWLVADRQTAGRGRQGRAWFDGSGNFMGSTVVLLGPNDPPPPTLALMAGLALYEAVTPMVQGRAGLSLKWPNDLLLDNAKLAGILLERVEDAVIVGIGVNLAKAPELPDRETVALSALGPAPVRDTFAHALAASFATELSRWRDFGIDPLLRRWQAVAHIEGTPLTVHEPDGAIVEGSYAGLASDGSLRLRLVDGSLRAIHAGDVMLATRN